ncbi:conserved hypothetical protein [Neospora caninum Liverpool]|uniref:Glycosyltransferase family protein n=1 Tax=Neospora caninum (strain Liverpool) TaxID=572307 RepID=F0VBA1_NEOCL|nr:conserved hypothetical protein [Neospora caninum Liverpool]CBZ50885.1 conserved hypothetical protein [Neospora caninum Liverpool]CEL68187.1 TPA: hypothetical protein BN1204_039600 [Neospora caninum Liverpool]|eukprot:XP_003880918.1 conserved hypothetical protein [Neospora caninum Liverpool]
MPDSQARRKAASGGTISSCPVNPSAASSDPPFSPSSRSPLHAYRPSDPGRDDAEEGPLLVASTRHFSRADAFRRRDHEALQPLQSIFPFLRSSSRKISLSTGNRDWACWDEPERKGRRVSRGGVYLFLLVLSCALASFFLSSLVDLDQEDTRSAVSRIPFALSSLFVSPFSLVSFLFATEEAEQDAVAEAVSLKQLAALASSSPPPSVENFGRISAPPLLLLASDADAFHPTFFSGLSDMSAAHASFSEQQAEREEAREIARERDAASPLTCVKLRPFLSPPSGTHTVSSLGDSLLALLEGDDRAFSPRDSPAPGKSESFVGFLDKVKNRVSSLLEEEAPWTVEREELRGGQSQESAEKGAETREGIPAWGRSLRRPNPSLFLPNWRVAVSRRTPVALPSLASGQASSEGLRRHLCVAYDREYGVRFVALLSALASPVTEAKEEEATEREADASENRARGKQRRLTEDECGDRVSLYDGCSSLPIYHSDASSFSSFDKIAKRRQTLAHMYWGGAEPLTGKELWAIDSFFAAAPDRTLRLHVLLPVVEDEDVVWDRGEAFGSSLQAEEASGNARTNHGWDGMFFASWGRRQRDATRKLTEQARGLHLSQLQLFWRKGYDLQYVQHVSLKPYLKGTPLAAHASALRLSSLANHSALFGLLRHSRQATVADILRALFLFREGGLYLDADMITLRSFASLPSFLVCENQSFERRETPLARGDTAGGQAREERRKCLKQRRRDQTVFRPCALTNRVFKFEGTRHLFLRDILHYIAKKLASASVGQLAVSKGGLLGPLAFREILYSRWVAPGAAGVAQEREKEEAEAREQHASGSSSRGGSAAPTHDAWYVLRFANSPPTPPAASPALLETRRGTGEAEQPRGLGEGAEDEERFTPFVRPLWLFGPLAFEPLQPAPRKGRFPVLESDVFWREEGQSEGFSELRTLGKTGPFYGMHLYAKMLLTRRPEGFLASLTDAPYSVIGVLQKTLCTSYCGEEMLRIFAGEEARQWIPDSVLDKIKAALSWL